tara:strand:+ start:2784 stop:4844 length:2061 start_codon:yes stop_codon:yes gene_type:complete
MVNKTKCLVPNRLQGTDGIRSEARRAFSDDKGSPQEIFLEQQIITDRFMELYAYAWAHELKQLHKSGVIVVGWDPRDLDGTFSEAVIRGVRKAGISVWVAGVIPTPLVPMLTVSAKAVGGIMITASHNPKDQNGIKLFSSYRGMKFLPDNDRILTQAVLKTSYTNVSQLKQTGKKVNIRKEALFFFETFSLVQENSWADEKPFSEIVLVVDPANGSLSRIAADIFRKARFGKVIEINCSLNGNVNVYGGVADLEGHLEITADMIEKASGLFRRHRAILKLFELGRKYHFEIKKKKRRVCGAVFDADGDRFYLVEYDPFLDRLIILSGDETAAHQARHLSRLYKGKDGIFLNTVESDLNVGRFAEKSGFFSTLVPVGDKWILSQIILSELKSRTKALNKRPVYLKKYIGKLEKTGVSDFYKLAEIEKMITKIESNNKIGSLPFAIGSEETGHNITAGKLPVSPWSNGGEIVFCGNGLKSALNTFSATRALFHSKTIRSFFKVLENPFLTGFKKTDYVYYVKKEKFYKNSNVWKAIKKCVETETQTLSWQTQFVSFPEDPDMLYFVFNYREVQGVVKRSALFVRNSGTENKIGVSLRGPKRDSAKLKNLGEQIIRVLIKKMKDLESEWTCDERRLMRNMTRKSLTGYAMGLKSERLQRLLAELNKQGLAEPCKGGYRLTSRGKWVTIL